MFALFAGLAHTRAATTERIVVDRHTGLAIGGYDRVAFFTDGRPKAGNPAFELRFCNIDNRAAFAAQPEVYLPQFGGYDPAGVAQRCGGSG
jgi:hypothetical protein